MDVTLDLINVQEKVITVAVTSTASSSTSVPQIGSKLRIVNEGPNIAFIAVGVGAQTATLPTATPTATATPVLAGSDVTFDMPHDGKTTNQISAICRASGTATLTVQVGGGS